MENSADLCESRLNDLIFIKSFGLFYNSFFSGAGEICLNQQNQVKWLYLSLGCF